MFAYCGNNPPTMMDSIGKDAVYVVDYKKGRGLPVVGHAYAYFQDADGTWYMAQYEGVFPDKSTAKITWSKVEDLTEIEKINNGEALEDKEYVYLSGNFSDCLNYAKEYESTNYGGYDLIKNNCMHFVRNLLLKGTFDNQLERESVSRYHDSIPRGLYNGMRQAHFISKIGGAINDAWKAITNLFENP